MLQPGGMSDKEYVLGTRDEELERLGLQHRVWRPFVLDAWRRAGLLTGMTALDVGAGPGFASVDLAEIVGPSGKVLAFERSRRFLDALAARADRLGLANVEAYERDVVERDLGSGIADFAWCRWLLCFVADPRRTVGHIAAALKPGGRAVFHEYADYGAWRLMPPHDQHERFRSLVMQSWRDAGGDPDVGARLPEWLLAEGLEIVEARPIAWAVHRDDFAWQWPASFMASGARRLAELGYMSGEEADRTSALLDGEVADRWMMTPLVLEVIARRR